jgi:uncharacterized protein
MSTTAPTLDQFAEQHTVLLTTFRRDGTPVGTPVSIVVHDGHAYFRTWHATGKAKRLRNNPHVEIAPFEDRFAGMPTGQGTVTGAAVSGTARLLSEAEAKPVRKLLAEKYPLLQRFIVPITHKVKRVRTLHYQLTLD